MGFYGVQLFEHLLNSLKDNRILIRCHRASIFYKTATGESVTPVGAIPLGPVFWKLTAAQTKNKSSELGDKKREISSRCVGSSTSCLLSMVQSSRVFQFLVVNSQA